jgi:adenylate cyclase
VRSGPALEFDYTPRFGECQAENSAAFALASISLFTINSAVIHASPQPPTELAREDVRAQLERILSSRCFSNAARATDFLRFVVEQTLAGNGPRLKGYTIGTEVFARPADFDPRADPLVRVEAGRLRSRLAEYYQSEGAGDPVLIELPRGGYAAQWRRKDAVARENEQPAVPRSAVSRPWSRTAAAFALVAVALTATLAWQPRSTPSIEPVRTVAAESPRVIVTPFDAVGSSAPELVRLAAGLTEELMLALGRLDVRVIATEPRWLDATRVDELSTRDYVLSGKVRFAGNRVRVVARLVERASGAELWRRSFDQTKEIAADAALQAKLSQEIAGVARPYGPIFDTELARSREDSHDCLARFLDYRRTMEAAPFRAALDCYQTLSLNEPATAEVWAGLGMLYLDDYGYSYGHSASLHASLMMAREAIERALALNRNLLLANMALARLHLFDGRLEELRSTVEEALARAPANVEARAYFGATLSVTGDARGIELVEEALAVSERQPSIVNMAYAVHHLRNGRAEEALEWAQRVAAPNWFPAQMVIAASAGLCGDEQTAARARARLLELYPDFEAEAIAVFERWKHDPALDRALISGLNKAGFAIEAPQRLAMP